MPGMASGGPSVIRLIPSVDWPFVSVLRAGKAMRVAGENTEKTWNAFDRGFDPLLDKGNQTTDDVLAVSLAFYTGELPQWRPTPERASSLCRAHAHSTPDER